MKTLRNIMIIAVILLAIGMLSISLFYKIGLKPVNKHDNSSKIVDIKQGSTTSEIATLLKKEGLIRNKAVFKFYLKVKKINNLQAATYEFSPNMSVEEIVNKISTGDKYIDKSKQVTITFREGLNVRQIATIIEENTNNTYNEVLKTMEDDSYIDSLIKEYWFLTDEIKNKDIYYPLEGYLFPNTYIFESKDVDVKTIFKKMLDETNKVLTSYKSSIEGSIYTVHEILTMASIVELEGVDKTSRDKIAGVFYDRIALNMSLGSDVTTYYAWKVNLSSKDLTKSQYNTYNPYNTRGPKMQGKLPVGPIANPSKESINATLNPDLTGYLYFVADSDKKVWYAKTAAEHQKNIAEIKKLGKWPIE